jgi:GNAT superfamily N-acetyltransferase
MPGRVVRRRVHLVYRYSGATPDLHELPAPLSYRRLDRDTVLAFFGRRDEDRGRLRQYLRLLERGCIGSLIADGDAWAAVGWVSHPGSMAPPHLSRRIIGTEVAWSFLGFTHPDYRRRGLQKAGLTYRVRLAREAVGDDAAPVHSDVSPRNVPSRRAVLRCTFVPAGRIHYARFGIPRVHTWTWGSWNTAEEHPPLGS